MICLRCGHCCLYYAVVLPDGDFYPGDGIGCKYLKWEQGESDRLNVAVCKIHGQDAVIVDSAVGEVHYRWDETPCGRHGQIERGNTPCRMGVYVRGKEST